MNISDNYTSGNLTNSSASDLLENNDNYYYYYYHDYEPYSVNIAQQHIPVLSIVFPIIGILTILGNILVLFIFFKQKLKTPTSVLLIELAISDSLVCLPIVILYIYIYSFGNYKHYLLFGWCIANHVGYITQQIFRSTSNWLTAILGVQRCIAVSYPFRAQRICTVKMSIISFVACIVGSLTIYINEAISIEITPYSKNSSLPTGCLRNIPSWYLKNIGNIRMSVMIYYLFNGLLTRLLPCLVLLITTISLSRTLCHRHGGMEKSIQESYSSKNRLRRTNILVVVILIIFLMAELQDAVAFCIYSYELAVDKPRSILPEGADDTWDIYGMVVTLLGYHGIFWIFFLMSSQFRMALKQAFSVCRFSDSKEDSVRVTFLRSSTRSGTSSVTL